MNKKEAKNRIEELRKQVEYHAKRYYDDDEPEISDFEYDMLMVELRNLEKKFPEFNSKESLTQKVGGHVKEGFEKVTHEVPLQSLQDVFSIDEVKEYVQKIEEKAIENDIDTGFYKDKIGVCPICGKDVLKSKYGYGCIGYKDGCNFKINFTICNRIISQKNAELLLKTGKTSKIVGFTSKNGKSFDAYLKNNNGKIEFEFN